ncbi:MAG TPA: Ig-like domain-containing protein [Pyrinomonadaceae bacterium]
MLSAKATDNGGATATSSTVNITVNPPNQAPTVSLTSPSAGQIFPAPANITLSANANDADGIVTKVQFFRGGSTLVAEDTSAPFTFNWTNVAAGNYSLTAKAFDNAGATTTSAAVAITVNALPSVSLSVPANGQVFTAPANITLTATPSDSDGTITKVQFFNGATLLNEDTSSPYTFAWNNVGAGTYSLTAKAFDNLGGTTTSAGIVITVNTLPTITITSPAHPTTFTAPASFTINASPADPDGSITKVEFFDGATLLGQDTTSPYSFNVSNLASGTHVLTAKATDNLGGTTTSSAVHAVVTNAPTTSITSPANNATFLAGANITINASASDSDGSIAKVEFFRNGVLLGEDTTSPYSFTWNTVPEGAYSLTTRATDNLSVTGTSAPVNINVNPNGISRLDPINRTGGANENPFSRNYNWTMPLLELRGRADLNLGLSLSYNSLVWTKSGSTISFDADKGFPSPGFRLGFPVIQGPFFNSDANKNIYILITPEGSRVELRQFNSTTLYEAVDSSYLLLDTSTMILRGYDGTEMSYQLYGTDFQCKEIKDRNGNFITINRAADGRINTIVDTLSRTINFVYNGTTLTSITQSWTVNGSPVTHTWASFQYRNPDLTINTNFSGLTNLGPQNGSTLKVLSGVTLGDNSRFEFEYTSWGQVWKISQFANDGQTLLNYRSYDLPLNNINPQSDCPRFSQRRDWARYWNRDAGGTEQEAITSFLWQANASWTMPPSGAADSGILSQVTLPDGTFNKIYSHATGWDKGLPVLIETYDNLQVRQRQTTNAWTQDDTQLTVPKNPRVTETNTFDPAGNRKRVRVEYQTFTLPNQTQCTLPRDFFEYKNATTVLRSTRTTYNHDSAFTTRRMIDRVSEQAVYDGDVTLSAPLVSKFTYGYDESGSIEAIPTPAVQHDAAYGTNFVLGRANLSSVKRHDVATSTQVTITTNKYNITGAMVSTKDALDHGVTFSYTDAFAANGTTLDAPRPFATLAYPTTINDAGGNSLTARYNYDFGAMTLRQTPLPNQTAYAPGPQETFTYDSAGRIERVTSLANNARQRYLYGPNYVQSWSSVNNVADESLSVEVRDGAGRVIATAKNHPGSQGGFSAEMVVFDVMGRSVKRSNPTETSITISSAPINPYAWLPNGDDSTWYFTQQTYDWKGRPLVTTNPDATLRTVSYSGCGCAGSEVVTLTDEGTIDPFDLVTARKRQKKIYSDVLGREVKSEVLNWEGGSVVTATVTNYNARDQIKMVRQFAGAAPADLDDLSCPSGTCQKTEMTYDGHGRLKTRHAPEEQNDPNNPGSTDHNTWDYNADDTIQKMTDPRGAVTNYSYNSRHRITNITYTLLPNVPTTGPSGVATAAAVGYEYDAAGNRKRMTDGLGEVNYTYDQLSRLTSETRFFSNLSNSPTGGNYTLGYEYNLAGQVTKVTDPNNVQVHYGFDNAGRLSGVTGTGFTVSTFLSNIQYRAWGAPKSVAHVNNRTTETTYDERLRVKTYKLLPSVPDDGIKLHNQYDYFPDGRLKKLTDLDDHDPTIIGFTDSGRWFTRVYRYDNHGRILRARGYNQPNNFEFDRPYDLSYGYDSFNHLVSRSGKYYYQTGFSDSGTFENNRRQGWDYAADGQEIHLTETGMFRDLTYNAAGKMVQVKETVTATNVFSTYVVSYDGDGHTAREFFQEDPANSNTYHLRSSVLGRVITRLNNAGNKTGTTVHLDNKVTTARINSTDTGNVPFPTYEDPLRYSIAGDKKAVYDPLGNHIPWQSSPQSNPPPFYPRSSASFGSLGSSFGSAQERGCVLDGVPTNCDRAMRMVNSGSAMIDPTSSNRQQLVENGFLDYWVYMGEERGFERQQYFLHNFRQGPQQAQPQQPTPQELYRDCRVQAMLDAIAWAEGTAGDADEGYGRVVRGTVISSPNNPALVGQTNVTITNFAQHPNILVQVTQTIRSTAAGRYQFLNRTWTGLNLPDFGRYNQDIGAIMLLQQAGAITPLLNGNVRQAAANANGTWASLPNSPLGQPTRALADFESAYTDSLVDCVIRQFKGLP